MPELPEVEHFRQILLPLVCRTSASSSSSSSTFVLECPPPLPTKRFPSQGSIDLINAGCYVIEDVLRKGKVLCVVLQKQMAGSSSKKSSMKKAAERTNNSANDNETTPITGQENTLYLSLHMGMTGRISSPDHVPGLESLSENDTYPPPHTHLILKSNGEEAAFSDPRRFGTVLVDAGEPGELYHEESIPTFQDIAVDALKASEEYCSATKKDSTNDDMQQPTLVEKIANRKKGIKGLLLDQRAVFSGVGNWVADEVLYRSGIHPDQSYLTMDESQKLVEETYHVLSTAVTCLNNGDNLPEQWLFHRRWRSGGGGGGTAKDYSGKTITFIQSGGRSTAIVPSLQKIKGRSKLNQAKKPPKKKKTNGKEKSTNKSGTKKSKAPAAVNSTESTAGKTKVQGGKRKYDSQTSSKKQSQPTRRSKRLASS